MATYLLAHVRGKAVEPKPWWYNASIDDDVRDVSYRLDIELLQDEKQPSGMMGYQLDMIRWASVEYMIMTERNSGRPPGVFTELQPHDIIKILTVPKSRDHVMIQVPPPRFRLPGYPYTSCEIVLVNMTEGSHQGLLVIGEMVGQGEARLLKPSSCSDAVPRRYSQHPSGVPA